MGSKKRESSSMQESVAEELGQHKLDDAAEKPPIKRIKKEKKKKDTDVPDTEIPNHTNGESTSSNAANTPLNSMERRKHRKILAKVKIGVNTKKNAPAPEKMDIDTKNDSNNENNESGGASNSNSGVLPEFHIGVFKDLAAADASVREAAANSLVTELREVQNAYDKLVNKDEVEDKSKLEAEKDDGLNDCAPSVRYAVRRLIRGLSSSRECARQGFALGLASLLSKVSCIKLESLLKLIVSLLEVNSSMKGPEAKDCLLGRLFAYGALAWSGILAKELISDNTTPLIKELTSCVINLAAKKRYLQESAVAVILEIIEKLPNEAISNHVLEAPGLKEWFEGATEAGNSDALLLALTMQEKFNVDFKFGKLLPSPYSKNALFTTEHLSQIASCLKESTFCQPRVHSIWPVLVNNLLPDAVQDADSAFGQISISTKKHKKSRKVSSAAEDMERNLRCFSEVTIEGTLLPSSHDRKKLAFDILLLLLPKLPSSCVHVVLSYKIVHCLMDILSTKDSWLFKVAQHFLKELSEWLANDDVRRVAVIVSLQKHSNGKFDTITKSKTVKDLMSDLKTESGCILFIQNLIAMFLDEGQSSDEPSDQSQTTDDNSEIGSIVEIGSSGTSEFLKSWIIEYLPTVSKHLKLDKDAQFRVQKEVLKFLAVQGLFSSSLGTEVTSFELEEKFRWPKSAIPNALSQMCIEQLQQLLANAQKGEGPHAVASGVEANDLGSYFMRFIGILRNIPSVSLSRALGADDEKAFKKLQAAESQLSKEERNCGILSKDASKLHALRYLLIQVLLQIVLRPGEFSEAASELVICCKKAFGSSDILESSGDDEPEGDDAPELMDVLVDTLLSLLPQSTAPMRSTIEQVFKYFCNEITEDGLLRMLKVIKKDLKPARHHNMDSEDDDDDDDDGEDDLLGLEEAEESGEAETGETAASDEQTEDSEAVIGVTAAQFPKANGDDDGDDSDDDEGMDDDEMFRMDSKLAEIFREKKNQAGGGGPETAHSQLVLFKLRVLSLLEIYLHENPGKPQVLKVFSNLAQTYCNPQPTEGSEQLSQRIWGVIQKKIFKAKEHPRDESVELPIIEPLLDKYLKLAAKPYKWKQPADPIKRKKFKEYPSLKKETASWKRHQMLTSLAQSSIFWMLKIIDAGNFPQSELQRVCDIFQSALVAYLDSKKSQMKCGFLKEIVKRRPWIGRHLFGYLLDRCGSGESQFRQVEALDLLAEILKSQMTSAADVSAADVSKKMLKTNLGNVCHLIKHLVRNMPERQIRRNDVVKFCEKVFQILRTFELNAKFLKGLDAEGHAACETELGKVFLALKNGEN